MTKVLFVAVEPPWPAIQGGRVRMVGLVESLAKRHDVTVVTWSESEMSVDAVPAGVRLKAMPAQADANRLSGFLSLRPRILRQIAGRSGIRELEREVAEGDYEVAIFSHTYLAAGVPDLGLPIVLDLANREHSRYRQFASTGRWSNRGSAWIEYWKARLWEPRIVARAGATSVLSLEDEAWVESVGGNPILVPLGLPSERATTVSPVDGPALFLGSMDYRPNQDGAKFLIEQVWPRVRAVLPEARLTIAGRGSLSALGERPAAGVHVVGEVQSVAESYARASLVVAPVASGGGRQLKILEALAHGRSIVCTPYSAESVPESLREQVLIGSDPGQFAGHVVSLLGNVNLRRQLEMGIVDAYENLPTWDAVVRPLADFLRVSREFNSPRC